MAAAIACIPLDRRRHLEILERHDGFGRLYATTHHLGGAWLSFNVAPQIVYFIFGGIPGIGGILVSLVPSSALYHIAFLIIWIVVR